MSRRARRRTFRVDARPANDVDLVGAGAPALSWMLRRRRARPGSPIISAVSAGRTDGVAMSHDWVRRYLGLLGVPRRAPDAGALAELMRAQVLGVPFENVTSLLRRRAHAGRPVPPIDADELLASWEAGRGGGVCYEIADLFGRLLAALGYRVYPVLGFITFPGSHQALLVQLGDERLLVDVGNGAPFFEPIALREPVEIRRAGLAYRFRPDVATEDWLQDRWIDGAWTPFCRYVLGPPDLAARAAAYQRHHTPCATWVTGSLTMIRCEEQQVVVLRDDELSRFGAAGKRTERISTLADYARIAAETFGLPALPIADGVAAWRENVARSVGAR
jgi:N-hydroxyarylamine O-acetyltransferase